MPAAAPFLLATTALEQITRDADVLQHNARHAAQGLPLRRLRVSFFNNKLNSRPLLGLQLD